MLTLTPSRREEAGLCLLSQRVSFSSHFAFLHRPPREQKKETRRERQPDRQKQRGTQTEAGRQKTDTRELGGGEGEKEIEKD